ncbi:Diapolycopene oxygenase [Pirellula sp. SH-Sr6A]|uniref:phytoene desaturase family protein n=1 Tax=Pirellula sp. SH-Sr6A TaxID=1632865 RepID=UPI00078D165C|nr:phytoene desaturase family protein [Pirellula sp. SH-Sr6A]AMV34431.1 Diapolycopene oxygenase [Pirellula sp. SH-Sr6A]
MIQQNGRSLNIGVVGGGLAGLAAACTLAARGHRVTLLEKNEWVGGKAAVHQQDGYRFDMGPTILTLPSVLKRIFSEANRKLEDYMDLVPLDPQWRCFFEDGSVLDLISDIQKMRENLDKFSKNPGAGAGYERFMQISKQLHKVSDKFFFWRSVGGIADTMEVGGAFSPAVLKDVLSLRMGRSVAGLVRSCVPDERAAQMIDHFTQYVGSSPEASPAVLCGIAHMQTEEGVWYPIGGTRAVPVALEKLARELGVDIRTSIDVVSIQNDGQSVRGVTTASGETFQFDAVVSNCDSVRTHRELLNGTATEKKFEKRRKYEPACSGVVLYLGLNQKYDHLLHHNFVFSKDPHEEFDYIYRQGKPAPDPTAYVCAPSISEPAVAPPGGEALYILVHTPYLRPEHDWSKMLPEYREVILDKLERTGGMKGIRDRIVCEASLTPEGIHKRYRVLNGAIYGLASHGKYLGAFKPANRSKDLKGLYLAGGAAHPGPGMPMVLMSGWIAGDTVDNDHQAGQLAATAT